MDKEYTLLFNAITDAIEILIKAQQQAEELVLSKEGVEIIIRPNGS